MDTSSNYSSFYCYCVRLLQNTFTKEKRKTTSERGVFSTDLDKPQYMLHDLRSEVRTGSQMCRF